jgi:hypothetical protein
MREYKLKAPSYFTKQEVEFRHHTGKKMIGIIHNVETYYDGDYGYHMYGIQGIGNLNLFHIDERKVLRTI